MQKAIEYLQMSAEQGNAMAQNTLGSYYEHGIGVNVDIKKAVDYYRLSANQQDSSAYNNLGACYTNGIGVLQNYTTAVEYYQLSIAGGAIEAQHNLGVCYEYGKGVPQDYKKAIELYTLGKCTTSAERCEICEKKLVEEFDILLHINDIVYMYPLCVKHKHRDADILKIILTRKYTASIPLIPDLTKLTISYLI